MEKWEQTACGPFTPAKRVLLVSMAGWGVGCGWGGLGAFSEGEESRKALHLDSMAAMVRGSVKPSEWMTAGWLAQCWISANCRPWRWRAFWKSSQGVVCMKGIKKGGYEGN